MFFFVFPLHFTFWDVLNMSLKVTTDTDYVIFWCRLEKDIVG